MSHDPLCYLYREDGEFNLMADRCVNCRLIAKVRADEQGKHTNHRHDFCGGGWRCPCWAAAKQHYEGR